MLLTRRIAPANINIAMSFSALADTSGDRTDIVRAVFTAPPPPDSPMVFVTILPGSIYTFAGYQWETPYVLNLAIATTGAVAGQSYPG
jgi:hypothetical protein